MPNMHTIEFDAAQSCVASEKLTASAQTGLQEVISGRLPNRSTDVFQKIPYQQFSRVINVCCMAEMLRNFCITSLRGDEIERFLELQSFFFALESKCLDEAGFE